MKSLLELFNKKFIPLSTGPDCPYFVWGEFDQIDLFWVIPYSRTFLVYRQNLEKIEFYKIVSTADKIPDDCRKVIEKYVSYDYRETIEAFFCKMNMDEVSHSFGKRYKFLLFNINKLE